MSKRIYWELRNEGKLVGKGTNPYGLNKFMNNYILPTFDWNRAVHGVNYTMAVNGQAQYYILKGGAEVTINRKLALTFTLINKNDPRHEMPFDSSIEDAILKASKPR